MSQPRTLRAMQYVGQTEGCSRSPRTKWASPFVPGQHGTHEECFIKYVLCFRSQKELRDSLNEIAGRELACECPLGQPCHADFLASQARMKPDRQGTTPAAMRKRGKLLPQLVMASRVGSAASACPRQGEIHQRWPHRAWTQRSEVFSPSTRPAACKSRFLMTS